MQIPRLHPFPTELESLRPKNLHLKASQSLAAWLQSLVTFGIVQDSQTDLHTMKFVNYKTKESIRLLLAV